MELSMFVKRNFQSTDRQDDRLLLTEELDFTAGPAFAIIGKCVLSGMPTIRGGRSKRYSIDQFSSLFIFILIFGFALTANADQLSRIPAFQNIEAALESSGCAVREKIVDVRQEHPALPVDAKIVPACVLLRRCSGCCQNNRHRCMPTSIYTSKVEFSQLLASTQTFNYVTLNFTHHAECLCQSSVNQTCVPRICSELETWNKEECRCEGRCAPRECGHREYWDPEKCRCQCQQCHPNRAVHSRFLQDEVTCLCICRRRGHERRRCGYRRGARFNHRQCTCIARPGGWLGRLPYNPNGSHYVHG